MQSNSVISHSPSFNSYTSSDKLAKIAARVVQEFQAELDFDDYLFDEKEHDDKEDEENKNNQEEEENESEEEEFEFAFVSREPDLSPIPADQIFYNGQIRPVYPLFNTDLLLAHDGQVENSISSTKTSSAVRLPLGKLFIEERERDTASSCSSSEADELDGVPAGTYCVWTPKAAEAVESPGRCNKSNSTGTSKRWKFRDLLHRSNSDGKDTFVFLAPSSKKSEGKAEKGTKELAAKITGNIVKTKAVGGGDKGNVRMGTVKESDRRRSYLPYKKDLVGVFANVNGVSRSLHPF